jgi:hypothetical protein
VPLSNQGSCTEVCTGCSIIIGGETAYDDTFSCVSLHLDSTGVSFPLLKLLKRSTRCSTHRALLWRLTYVGIPAYRADVDLGDIQVLLRGDCFLRLLVEPCVDLLGLEGIAGRKLSPLFALELGGALNTGYIPSTS